MKEFNVTGTCIASENYMVDISEKLEKIVAMIDKGQYFTINRARQYGKTTTFFLLDKCLADKYHVIWLSFEGTGENAFKNDAAFLRFFVKKVAECLSFLNLPEENIRTWEDITDYSEEQEDAFDYLSNKITVLCRNSEKDIIVMIDEVDKSSDNQIFLNFLGMLRNKFLFRKVGRDVTFKSVILAGVYDIKNLKLKIRPDAEKKYNSPWNIATDFEVDMSFSTKEIATMLAEYENDYHTGMDIELMSQELYFYTSGYPFLVSSLCKWVDEKGNKQWTVENIQKAENALLRMRNTLFDDIVKNYENNIELKTMIDDMLFEGKKILFTVTDNIIDLGKMYGIFKEKDGYVAISNVIFDTLLYNHILSRKMRESAPSETSSSQFVIDGKLNMTQILLKFQELMQAEYRSEDEKFYEKQGRLLFLCFLKPIINGTGFYYVEPETRDSTHMDIVVAYGGEEHIIELKIWRGKNYRRDGIEQLENYMNSRNAEKGYLVSFSFQKNKHYKNGWLTGDETKQKIYEVII